MNNGKYRFFTAKEIKPDGWLRKQLELQADGQFGNLDKIWPDVRDSAWIGGDRDGWERVPYWLDGFVPMAYLLDDEDKKSRAQKYIEAIIAAQKPDGWICPCPDEARADYDIWALFIISKALVEYHHCTGDARIPEVIYRAMINCYDMYSKGNVKLRAWGKSRWYECFVSLNWLRDYYNDAWISDFAKLLRDQGQDYRELTGLWKTPLFRWRQETHIVNLAMMLKSEALSCGLLNEEYTDIAGKLHSILNEYNGTPVGLYTGDECLAGLSPIHGTELCAVVEQMYSYETLYAFTGDPVWAERLEMLAFNALPATIDDLMQAHQYVQLSNQIACCVFPGKSPFRTNGSEAHIFGLEPNFGCCTANFGQGWPKLALSGMMCFDKGIINAVPLPMTLNTRWKGTEVRISLKTEYPFRNSFDYCIEAGDNTDLRFSIRIPSFAKNIKVNGKAVRKQAELSFCGFGKGKTNIHIEYETVPVMFNRPHGLKSVRCGSLVFSLPIKYEVTSKEYEKNGVERKAPFCDYEYNCRSEWNYAFAGRDFTPVYLDGDEIPFSSVSPRVALQSDMVHINWGLEDGYEKLCAKIPQSRKPESGQEKLLLYPYGCAKLRMTEMPLVKCKNS